MSHASLARSGKVAVTSGTQHLSKHFNELSRRARATALFLKPDIDGAVDGVCSVEPYEEYERTLGRHVSPIALDYPHIEKLKNT